MRLATRTHERAVLLTGLAVAVAAGGYAYQVIGPYGDGPFGAGYRRVPDPDTGRSFLVYDFNLGDESVVALAEHRSPRFTAFQFDGDQDGHPDATARITEPGLVRVERDADDDGVIDRWEYYDAASELQKIGFSLASDGVLDAWAHYGPDGELTMIEVSTARDEQVDRWEYYEDGTMVRTAEDTTGDGQPDRWSTYVDGVLQTTTEADATSKDATNE